MSGAPTSSRSSVRSSRNKDDYQPILLDTFLPYQISVLADQIARRTTAILKDRGILNLSQWRVMAAIADQPGRTAQEVVALTPMDKGIVSRAVKTLIEEGIIDRQASPHDGRLGHLYLKAEGYDLYVDIAQAVEKIETDLLSSLDPEQAKNLKDIFSRVFRAL